jgi:type I restriction enzyme S subunit
VWQKVTLRRLLDGPAVGGTWGSDPSDGETDVACVRGTDFDHKKLVVNEERLPIRSVSRRDLSARGLRPGDLILEKSGGGEQQPVGRCVRFTLDRLCVPTNFACRLRPLATTSDRFLAYLLASLYSLGVTRRAIKQTTGIQNLDTEVFLAESVRAPDRATQERIADFLDNETARIDALIEKKRWMVILQRERIAAACEAVIWHNVTREIPLMYLVDPVRPIMYGIVLPGPDVEEGVPIVKGGDVRDARLRLDLLCRTTPEIEQPYARARLRPDDIVFAIRGGIGDAALVPAKLNGANITQDVARISCGEAVHPSWLLLALRSLSFQARCGSRITGATIRGLNICDLQHLRVPWVDRSRQELDLARLQPLVLKAGQLNAALDRQIELLSEHRQALITAAVTGNSDLDLSEVAA